MALTKVDLSLMAELDQASVGLDEVDNTSDADKPISTATQAALDLKAPLASPTFTGTVGGISKGMVGLGNVDNTADSAKPISTATQTALDDKEYVLVEGANITIDRTDPLAPIISSTGGGGGGSGDVSGPGSSTANAVAGFNGTTGKIIKQLTDTEIRAAAALATTDSPMFTAINLGHASDTSITRVSAGVIAVEGDNVLLASAIGSSVQAYDADLTTWAGKTAPSGAVVGTTDAQALTTKTIDAASNTITNLATSMFAANVIDTDVTLAANSDTRIPSQKAVKAYAASVASGLGIGDIQMSFRDLSGGDYLDISAGAGYSKSTYSALFAAIEELTYPDYNASATRLANPATLPANDAFGVAWSPDGKYVAFAHNSSPYITIYDMSTGAPVKTANPSTLPVGNSLCVAWSPDSRFVAVGTNSGNRASVYDMNSGTPVKVADAGTAIGSTVNGICWSPDGAFISFALEGTPYLAIYPWSTSGFGTRLANAASLPAGATYAIDWDSTSRYIAIAHSNAPRLTVYDMDTGAPVKESAPNTPIASGDGTTVLWYKGLYIALGNTSALKLACYDFTSESVPTRLTDPAAQPSGTVASLNLHPSGDMFSLIDSNATGEIQTYSLIDPSLPVQLPVITNVPAAANIGTGVAWAPHGKFLALSYDGTSTFMSILDMDPSYTYNPYTEFRTPIVEYGWLKFQ